LTGDRRFFLVAARRYFGRRLVKVPDRRELVGYPSGQRGQTVNLLAYAFDGSNPSPTTTLFPLCIHGISPLFTMVYAVLPYFGMCASVRFLSFADFSKKMLRKLP
jgi:hypothetical protein